MGINVKDVVPDLIDCPGCKKRSLQVHMDPFYPQGRWLYCDDCRCHGDPLETYGRLKHSTTTAQAVVQAVTDGFFRANSSLVTPDTIQSYVDYCVTPRKKSYNCWAQLSESMRCRSPQVRSRLQKDHLWCGWRSAVQERLTKFLGMGLKRDLVEIFREPFLPREGFHENVVLNFQDVPGRICNFKIIDSEGREYVKDMSVFHKEEGGLCMLDTVRPFDDTVIAMQDWWTAMQLQKMTFADSPLPMKMVVYAPNTNHAWRSVCVNRLIFWVPEVTAEVLKHARKAANSWISTQPGVKGRRYTNLYEVTAKEFAYRVERGAQPWLRALIDYLMTPGRDEAADKALMHELQLSATERQQLMDQAVSKERVKLEYFLGSVASTISFQLNKHTITERPDGWWITPKYGAEELLCDAKIKVDYEITDADKNEIYWQGNIKFGTHSVPFWEPVEVFKDDLLGWLYNKLVAVGVPTIHPRHKCALLYAIQRSSHIRRVSVRIRIGIQQDGRIQFPRFFIDKGEVVQEPLYLYPPNGPAQKVAPPKVRVPTPDEPLTNLGVAWTAIAAAWVYNLLRGYDQKPAQPVLLVGASGSVVRRAADIFAEQTGMYADQLGAVQHNKAQKARLDALRAGAGSYGYMRMISTSAAGQLVGWPADAAEPVLLTARPLEAAALKLNPHWLVVEAPEVYRGEIDGKAPPVGDLLFYLSDLQRRGYAIERDNFKAVLVDFVGWYARYLCLNVDRALELFVKVNERLTPLPLPADGLLKLCATLFMEGYMGVDHVSFNDKMWECKPFRREHEAKFLIDDHADLVFIPASALKRALHTAAVPWPDLSRITEDIVTRQLIDLPSMPVDGWLFKLAYFNEKVKNCT